MSILAQTPPMGFNTWNTFGSNIDEKMILEITDALVEKGYKDAGYEYVVIDDCWLLRDRDENGHLVPDPEKFPHGMKYVADYIHKKGLKFGMYSCAGTRTCGGFPSSFDYEYIDANTFASWEIDFLKYDFCNFPSYANCRNRYLTMSQALRSTGRDIVFSACNWGCEQPWNWMRSIGAHMYRSTGDIFDTFESTKGIIKQQMYNYNANASGCFNDTDMLTVGMEGNGLVGKGDCQSYNEYELEFAYWCFTGAPLMIGSDIRKIKDEYKDLLTNPRLIALNQDEECRPAYKVCGSEDLPVFIRHLSKGKFAICALNFLDADNMKLLNFGEMGVPATAQVKLKLTDVITGEEVGLRKGDYRTIIPAHSCKVFTAEFVKE